ncbi:MAG: radical SAM protein [Verrucomicrobiaceae bacterium]|nr:radical SAM protein [Verrucomicrobiaceae bacterium]
MIIPQIVYRALKTADPECLRKAVFNLGIGTARSVVKFKQRMKRGEYFPAFLYISILNSCNLRCQGCWVDVDKPREAIPLDGLNRIINDARENGNRFFGLLGGEPFMYPELIDLIVQHPDCYFQIFTNGQLITDKKANQLRQLGNVTPLISIEGSEIVSNERRGGKDVLNRTLRGLDACLNNGLLTGVATSLCQSNIDDLLREEWLSKLIDRGVHYAWYHTYRPVGPQINPQLALTPEQLRRVRQFVVDMRAKLPLLLIDSYYDHKGQALCPMTTGISHHISPTGAVEPCPIIQFSRESALDSRGIYKTMTKSSFLKDFRETAAKNTRGCIVLERPDLVQSLVERHDAEDSTIRKTAMSEIQSMSPRPSQYIPGEEIPEKHWMYRLAKSIFFNDFGAYSEFDPSKVVAAPASEASNSDSESSVDDSNATV